MQPSISEIVLQVPAYVTDYGMGFLIGAAITITSYFAMMLTRHPVPVFAPGMKGSTRAMCYILGGSMYFAIVYAAIRALGWDSSLIWANGLLTPRWHSVVLTPTLLPRLLNGLVRGVKLNIGFRSPDEAENPHVHSYAALVNELAQWHLTPPKELVELINDGLRKSGSSLKAWMKSQGLNASGPLLKKLANAGYSYDEKRREFRKSS